MFLISNYFILFKLPDAIDVVAVLIINKTIKHLQNICEHDLFLNFRIKYLLMFAKFLNFWADFSAEDDCMAESQIWERKLLLAISIDSYLKSNILSKEINPLGEKIL